MTHKCGRIDVKYANCSYRTRIGPGKRTHDPTLFIMFPYLLLKGNKYVYEVIKQRN